MVEFKLVIGTKQGKCLQKEVKEPEARAFLGKKIGDKIPGNGIGFQGYEFLITGGSDHCGFPMRKDVDGPIRKRILAVQGVGLKKKSSGIRKRKTVCGNTIHPKISQINLKVITEGKEPLIKTEETKEEEKKEKKPAEKKEAKPQEKPAEKKEEIKKPESTPSEEKKEEKPAEENKEGTKPAEEKKEEKPEAQNN